MFKKCLLILVLLCVCTSLFAAVTLKDYEPYNNSEFPKWTIELRRAETIFFGGIPITFPLTVLGASLIGKDLDFWPTLGIACSVSAFIAILDYVVGVVNDN